MVRFRDRSWSISLQPLESRVLLSAIAPVTTSTTNTDTTQFAYLSALSQPSPSDLLTKTIRQNFLSHWSGSNKADLQAKLDANKLGAFDELLLSYMQNRAGQQFLWNSSDNSDIVSFIKSNLSTGPTIGHGDDLVSHLFPEQSGSDTYTIQLPSGVIDWSTQPSQTDNPEFLQSLHRMEFWSDLSQAYRFTGDSKYINELINQLASWSQQNPALADPNTWKNYAPRWNLLDASLRVSAWCWAYQMIVDTAGWTPAANTLMLVRLWDQGDFLRRVTAYALSSNRSIFQAEGLLNVAQLVPEFSNSADWRTYSRKLLFGAMDAQLYADGGHVEESPGYAANILNDLLELYWLDQVKGSASAWPAAKVTQLNNAMQSHMQLLSPNGALAALSDTYRSTAVQMFTKARIILNSTDYPSAKPRLRDVWMFGTSTCQPLLSSPVTPQLGDRGKSFGMSDSGYYVMRSGSDTSSRQLTFDAGPTGGIHGHLDLLNFELFGYGKPLISDPGLYKYDDSANRLYVVSTRAHNTINVDGDSHAALEGAHNSGIVVDQWSNDVDHAQITAHHFGYSYKSGSPVVSRSIWYDYDGTALIVDWGEATVSHTYQISFNLPGDSSTVSGVQPDGSFRTKYSSGNVQVAPLLRTGQVSTRGDLTFVSNHSPPDESDPAYRFRVTDSGKFVVFATLVTAYGGATPPNTTAEWITQNPDKGTPIVLRLTKNGVSQDITFQPPVLQRPPANLASTSGAINDMAWDASGRLHMAYFDRTARNLKYTVRDTDGNWSIIQTIDPNLDTGVYLSLALDSKGNPGVAYFDGNFGDLKYAKFFNNSWKIDTIDSAGSVGLYPSLVFSRNDGPVISYYHRTKGDLRMATSATEGYAITTIDSAGDVGRSSSLSLDPNRPDVSKFAVAYEVTSAGAYRYAIQYQTGWKYQTVDATTPEGGGYVSLAFEAVKATDGTYHPGVSYYDASISALKFGTFDGLAWSNSVVANAGTQGLYTNLFFDGSKKANIFFYDKTRNVGYRARGNPGSWLFTKLAAGGRAMSVARRSNGVLAYSSLNEAIPELDVLFLSA